MARQWVLEWFELSSPLTGMFAYYVLTHQELAGGTVKDRKILKTLHKVHTDMLFRKGYARLNLCKVT